MKTKKRKLEDTEKSSKPKSKKVKIHNQVMVSSSSLEEERSPFHIQTSSLYLPLSPVSQRYPIEGICAEHLSPLILTYYPPFNGLILSYSDPVLSENSFQNDGHTILLKNHDEYGVSWAWLTAEFLVLKPEKGTWLEGVISLQNDGFIGVVCWNLFNASIERRRLPSDWKWKDASEILGFKEQENSDTHTCEGAGTYIDGQGRRINGVIKFRVADIESCQDRERGFLTIVGTMLSEEEELAYITNEEVGDKNRQTNTGRRLGGPNALGATNLGVVSQDVKIFEDQLIASGIPAS
ncbi:DNA-directed RNA polymerase I subunit RPA43 [Golovinomyces cichoracearum]|uniref:DNA-directed RNA polymerase subunit n=1 Tax=Golovinomyces cichoracearum TaxID=62708 RepID=A0A420IS14_9PEZI|nr:DNA-directed RNA polymerase I subunit RPA43 [Golovinomyces cichoracearum]